MRYMLIVLVIAMMGLASGCHRAKTVADFPLSASLTLEDLEDKVGAPAQEAPSGLWVSYTLANGQELRLFFLNGPKGGTRLLSLAELRSPTGMTLETVFRSATLDAPATAPATSPSTAPATVPSTAPATTSPAI